MEPWATGNALQSSTPEPESGQQTSWHLATHLVQISGLYRSPTEWDLTSLARPCNFRMELMSFAESALWKEVFLRRYEAWVRQHPPERSVCLFSLRHSYCLSWSDAHRVPSPEHSLCPGFWSPEGMQQTDGKTEMK